MGKYVFDLHEIEDQQFIIPTAEKKLKPEYQANQFKFKSEYEKQLFEIETIKENLPF